MSSYEERAQAAALAQARTLYEGRLKGLDDYQLLDLIQYPGMEHNGINYINREIEAYVRDYLTQDTEAADVQKAEAEAKQLDLARVDRMLVRLEEAFDNRQVGPLDTQTPLPAVINAFTKLIKLRQDFVGHVAPKKIEGVLNVNHTLANDTKSVDAELQELADKLGISNIVDAEIVEVVPDPEV